MQYQKKTTNYQGTITSCRMKCTTACGSLYQIGKITPRNSEVSSKRNS